MTAKKIMLQGTMSDVGKSLIAAALCRIFAEEGYRVAPFKSQNMALNSGVTADGLEMGRAQILQARAALRAADVRMNPILLKPEGDRTSQVIINGKAAYTKSAADYFSLRKDLLPVILQDFSELSEENDIIVIEGAGSPAEINLNKAGDDIVNMGLAAAVDAPVLIVADIDRGGAFAQCLGTVEWMFPAERTRVQGFIFNKFRGDPDLLAPGPAMLLERTGIPLLGVVPYIDDLQLDAEDSLSGHFEGRSGDGPVDIAVIRFPHISNFTDLTPLAVPGLTTLRFVTEGEDLGNPDLIILPGTKTTLADLRWLKKQGLFEGIRAHAAAGGAVFGICGGYQMLGESLKDPAGADGGGSEKGLSLLSMETVFGPEKTLRRVRGKTVSGIPVEGYEIHAGRSRSREAPLLLLEEDGHETPAGSRKNHIAGCYVHGLFDGAAFTKALLSALLRHKGLSLPEDLSISGKREREEADIKRLSDTVRAAVDLSAVKKAMGL